MNALEQRFSELTAQAGEKKAKWTLGAGDKAQADKGHLTSQAVNLILEQAILDRASDVHFEPDEKSLNIRFRVDGQLYPVLTINDPNLAVLARMKIMAGLATDAVAKRHSQDGRFSLKMGASNYDFRLSTFPTVQGEKAALRVLSDQAGFYKLDKLGLDPQEQARIAKLIQHKSGLVLVSGPTGCGKTTTLYAMLGELNSPRINIVTLEDPVEFQLKGVNQCDIKSRQDFTFADGLKAVLRQDPNIILVGEMRDGPTAEIALRASMTGHLVLSSIHANNALGTVMRLINMGMEPYMVSYALIGAIAQRLVRTICDHCRGSFVLNKIQSDRYRALFGDRLDILIPKAAPAAAGGLTYVTKGEEAASHGQMVVYKGKGCEYCSGTGFRGRMGIYEIVVFDDELREAVIRGAPLSELQVIAVRKGTKLLKQDALERVQQGLTTLDEVSGILLE